jgi:hypothetical protein
MLDKNLVGRESRASRPFLLSILATELLDVKLKMMMSSSLHRPTRTLNFCVLH